MEINISPEEQKAMKDWPRRMAQVRLSKPARLLADALERQADYDRWFREKVREGRAAAERGNVIEHEEVGRCSTSLPRLMRIQWTQPAVSRPHRHL